MSSDRIEVHQLGLTAENGNIILEGVSVVARTPGGETIDNPAGLSVDGVQFTADRKLSLSLSPAMARSLLDFLPRVIAEAESPVERIGNVYRVRFDRT